MQFSLSLSLMLLLRWIVDSSHGPAAEIFQLIWAISLLLLLWPTLAVWSHYKVSKGLLTEVKNYDPTSEKVTEFWERQDGFFPYFKSPI